jgi:putative Mg2+ transporter-C (MgtC) family protein
MELNWDIVIRLFAALIIGGIIGAEREYRSKSAGFRTMMLICLGAALFTILSIYIGSEENRDRIAASIITGIGFLGAGVIWKDENRVNGITTAATIWITAALGMGIGAGYLWLSAVSCVVVLAILFAFTFLESWLYRSNQLRNYRIVCSFHDKSLERYELLFQECKLTFKKSTQNKQGGMITGNWLAQGSEKNHKRFIDLVLNDPEVKEFDF